MAKLERLGRCLSGGTQSDWQSTISDIDGDADAPFYKGLANQDIADRGEIVFSGNAADLDRPDVRRHLLL